MNSKNVHYVNVCLKHVNQFVYLFILGLYLRWQNIEARIIRPNILATNGIIHVVDRFLLSTPYQTTTIPTTTRSTQKTVSSSQQVVTSTYIQIIAFVISLYCYKFWNRELVLSWGIVPIVAKILCVQNNYELLKTLHFENQALRIV